MCKLNNKFQLCTCAKDLTEEEIEWFLLRRKPNESNLETYLLNNPRDFELNTIGRIYIPEKFRSWTPEEIKENWHLVDEELEKEAEEEIIKNQLIKEKESVYKNLRINIQFDLNNRNCFDKELLFQNEDVLCLLLDEKFDIWTNFIYHNDAWTQTHLKFSLEDHLQIIKGHFK